MKNSRVIGIMVVAITSASILVGCDKSDMGNKDNTNDKVQIEEQLKKNCTCE